MFSSNVTALLQHLVKEGKLDLNRDDEIIRETIAAQAGQILVSESCQSLSAGLVTFKSLPPRKMEGFPAPVPCYELVEISGLTRWRARSTKGLSSFVGRTEETSVLQRAAQARAFLDGRDFCLPDDFKQLAVSVFAHRVVASARHASLQRKSETTETALREIVDSVRIPL